MSLAPQIPAARLSLEATGKKYPPEFETLGAASSTWLL